MLFIINEGNSTEPVLDITHYQEFEKYMFENTAESHRGQ